MMWIVKGLLDEDWIDPSTGHEILEAFKPLISEDVALDINTYIEEGSSNAEVHALVVETLQGVVNSFMQTRLLIKNNVPAILSGLRLQDVYFYYLEGHVPSGIDITEIRKHLTEILGYGSAIRLTAKVATTQDEFRNYLSAIKKFAINSDEALDCISSNSMRVYSPNAKQRPNPMAAISYAYADLAWMLKSLDYLDIVNNDKNLDAKGVLYNFAST